MKTKKFAAPKISASFVSALTFLAKNPFRPLTDDEREGFSGASDAALIFEDGNAENVWIFDPTPDADEDGAGPRIERYDVFPEDGETDDSAEINRGWIIEKVTDIRY